MSASWGNKHLVVGELCSPTTQTHLFAEIRYADREGIVSAGGR